MRRFWKLTDRDGRNPWLFPKTNYEEDIVKPYRTKLVAISGKDGAYDYHGDYQAPRDVGTATARFTLATSCPADTEEQIAAMREAARGSLREEGLRKLWRRDDYDSSGPRFTLARIRQQPKMPVSYLNLRHVDVEMDFLLRDPVFYEPLRRKWMEDNGYQPEEIPEAYIGEPLAPDLLFARYDIVPEDFPYSFSIHNAGRLASREAVLRFEMPEIPPVAAYQGSYSGGQPTLDFAEGTYTGSAVGVQPLQFAQGTYVGDGTASKSIACGFEPKVVVVKADSATAYPVFRTDTMTTEGGITLNPLSSSFPSRITLTATGFDVEYDGGDSIPNSANASGITYYWYAFTGDNCYTGTYTGNGTAKTVSDPAFSSKLVLILTSGVNSYCRMKTDTMPSGADGNLHTTWTASGTTGITAITSSGFSVGSLAAVNTNGTLYHYFCIASSSANFVTGSYAGNGSDSRDWPTTALPFNPSLVQLRPAAADSCHWKPLALAGDASSPYSNTPATSDRIQSLTAVAGKFQVGTLANVNLTTYHYWVVSAVFTGQVITGLPFAPKMVVIKSDSATPAAFRTDVMSNGVSAVDATVAAPIAGLTGDGFAVTYSEGDEVPVNEPGVDYYWYAIGGSGCFTGSYIGNIAGQNIAVPVGGVEPDLVLIVPTSGAIRYRVAQDSRTWDFDDGNGTANEITALAVTGFSVGTSAAVDTTSATYYYVVITPSDNFAQGFYNGVGFDNFDVPTTPMDFNPQIVHTKRDSSSGYSVFKVASLAGDAALRYTATAVDNNLIKSLTASAGQFRLGTDGDVNAGSTAYFWFAFGTPVASSEQTIELPFGPKVVIVKGDDSTHGHAVIRTDTMSEMVNMTDGTITNQGIDTVDPLVSSFTVNNLSVSGGRTSDYGITYHFLALAGDSVQTGTYTGDANEGQNISLDFQPTLVWVIPPSGAAFWWTPNVRGCHKFDNTTPSPYHGVQGVGISAGTYIPGTAIPVYDPDEATFFVNGNANTNGAEYHFVAFAGDVIYGIYRGNGAPDAGWPDSPEDGYANAKPKPEPRQTVALIIGNHIEEYEGGLVTGGDGTIMALASFGLDQTVDFATTAKATNMITNIQVDDAFAVGSNVKANRFNQRHHYFMFTQYDRVPCMKDLLIRNTRTGSEFTTGEALINQVYSINSGLGRARRSPDGGVTWVDDTANVLLSASQVDLLRIDPGENDLEIINNGWWLPQYALYTSWYHAYED